jgi:hypothetical protein
VRVRHTTQRRCLLLCLPSPACALGLMRRRCGCGAVIRATLGARDWPVNAAPPPHTTQALRARHTRGVHTSTDGRPHAAAPHRAARPCATAGATTHTRNIHSGRANGRACALPRRRSVRAGQRSPSLGSGGRCAGTQAHVRLPPPARIVDTCAFVWHWRRRTHPLGRRRHVRCDWCTRLMRMRSKGGTGVACVYVGGWVGVGGCGSGARSRLRRRCTARAARAARAAHACCPSGAAIAAVHHTPPRNRCATGLAAHCECAATGRCPHTGCRQRPQCPAAPPAAPGTADGLVTALHALCAGG